MMMMQTTDDENLKVPPKIHRRESHDIVLHPVVDAEHHRTSHHRTTRCD